MWRRVLLQNNECQKNNHKRKIRKENEKEICENIDMYLNMKDEKLTTESDINDIIIEDKAYLNIKENIEFRYKK